MKAEDVKFTGLFDGPRQYIVPVFQRDYSWGISHCQQLWDDVLRVGSNQEAKAHFVGSVVYIAAEDIAGTVARWLLIDGQQRITTVTLLLAALRSHILGLPETEIEDENLPSAEELDDYYLRNRHGRGERRHKLRLRRADHDTLTALIDGTDLPAKPSFLIQQNYNHFVEQLADADLRVVYQGIQKLVAVDVSLTRGQDDPQMIFESLNSTGKDLTQADLVRNFVLMRQEEEQQTKLYTTYWQPIEVAFGNRYSSHFDRFMRDYLTLQMRPSKPLNSEEVYVRFKEFYAGKLEGSVDVFLAELKRFAHYYAAYNFELEPNAALKLAFQRLRTVVDVASPVMLQLYDAYDQAKTLTPTEFREAAELLESYVFRRSVCEMQTRSLGNIFVSLALRIKMDSPLQSLKVALFRQGDSRKFPSDGEFLESLASRDVYHMRHCWYLLDRLENDSNERIDTSGFTIEHVMPQNEKLGAEWKEMLGTNWQEIQQTWLHRLGNITLTGYNSKYSDRSFQEKTSIQDGFTDSPLRLNKFIREQKVWTPAEMERRGKELSARALKLWPPLMVEQKWVKAAELEDHKNWAARYPVENLAMENNCKAMFDLLRPHILALGEDVHELGQNHSIIYRVHDFFVELVPRKYQLQLMLNLDVADLDTVPEGASDATQYTFVIHARERGGILFDLNTEGRLADAIQLVKMAYQRVTE
jgi:uncharacterized protein with ParB-like and HNH nuclease domain/predicted transport protein